MNSIETRACRWVVGPDTGLSSKTIWAVMMGVSEALEDADVPYDRGDFGRCHRLLSLIPEWHARLSEVADAFPRWRDLVANWSELNRYFDGDVETFSKLLQASIPS